ncbi:phage baseplate assembly protein V [Halochromatium glycolicum]|uniref:Type IV secretion protein Rhs n=1 Tax=Halochromatium glycolicum TaxID=85075 RepID=A0AAJ0XAD7_9GAMM|nr:phage baseplate assembly protein V [Halochromatium glycolicum]MBK1704707.1 type IV secretion protein Rhs [Halochromatium glycolicum]
MALDRERDARIATGLGGRFYGVYPAVVTDLNDPEGQGRVRIRLPWSPDDSGGYEAWARLATLMGGNNRGSWFVPDLDDEVLVVFQAGDTRWPFVIGGLWNGVDTPPEQMDASGNNDIKSLRSRNGVKVTLDDASGQERLILETPGGQQVSLTDGPGVVELRDSNGNTVTLESSGITLSASAKVTVQASTVEVSAGSVTVNAGISRFSGVVQADTVITNSVVSASYTPGAGNIW